MSHPLSSSALSSSSDEDEARECPSCGRDSEFIVRYRPCRHTICEDCIEASDWCPKCITCGESAISFGGALGLNRMPMRSATKTNQNFAFRFPKRLPKQPPGYVEPPPVSHKRQREIVEDRQARHDLKKIRIADTPRESPDPVPENLTSGCKSATVTIKGMTVIGKQTSTKGAIVTTDFRQKGKIVVTTRPAGSKDSPGTMINYF
jgi:hypothetical protein